MKEQEKQNSIQERPKSRILDRLLFSLFSMVIVASLVCVAGVFTFHTTFLQSRDDPEIEEASRIQGIETPTEVRDKSINVLVTGIDYTEKAGNNRGKLTDMILLVSYDIENGEVNVLQIPRDTYVGDATSTGKINAVYGSKSNGGINGLLNKVNAMFSMPIDHYVTINMDGFVKAVDAIGGVEVDVPQGFTLEGITIHKGVQVLDGIHAEKFVRERHAYKDGDLGRIRMQQIFLEALIKKMLSLSLPQATSLATTLFPEISTDFTLNEVLSLYQEIRTLNTAGVHFYLLPTAPAMANGQAVLSVKRYPTADLLNESFRPHQRPVAAGQLNVIELVKDYEYTPSSAAVESDE